jgi:hypothetical protein
MNPTCEASCWLHNGRHLDCNLDEGHEGPHMLLIGGAGAIERGGLHDVIPVDRVVFAWPQSWGPEAGRRKQSGWASEAVTKKPIPAGAFI